jgi:hypothetical protein
VYGVQYSLTALLSCCFAVRIILAGKRDFIFSKRLKWVLRPTHSPIQWLPVIVSLGERELYICHTHMTSWHEQGLLSFPFTLVSGGVMGFVPVVVM